MQLFTTYLCRPKSTADVILLIQDSEIQSSKVKVLEAHQARATIFEKRPFLGVYVIDRLLGNCTPSRETSPQLVTL